MRKRNSVRQLGRTYAHRKAMFNNMVTSLILHEKIVTTKQKGKELKKIADRMIILECIFLEEELVMLLKWLLLSLLKEKVLKQNNLIFN